MSNTSNDTSHVMPITPRPPIVMTEGKGSWIRDTDGREYLDFVQGWAVNCLGHCPDVVIDALNTQAARLINASPAFYNEPMVKLTTMLSERSGFDHVFFANSGAEANEGALKLARKWGSLHRDGAYEVVTAANSFHGRTLAMMSASGKPEWQDLFEPKVPGFTKVPLNDIDAMDAAITGRTVAVMIEPIQGEAGVHMADADYLRALRDLTRERNVLLIFDEIQTGIGRTGKLFGFEHSGVDADIMTLGKGIGAGVPIAALLATSEVSCFEPGDQGGTFNGNPLMTAVAQAVVETVGDEAFLARVTERGEYLARRLRSLGLGEVRGQGLLLAVAVPDSNAKDIAVRAIDNNLLINAPRPDTLRFMPALNVSTDEIDTMTERLVKSIG